MKTIADKYKLPYTIGKKGNERFYADNGRPIYPENDGAIGEMKRVILKAGTIVDRYGDSKGTFVSPTGVQLESRALPRIAIHAEYHKYKIEKDFVCLTGKVAPWFGEKGRGTQYKLEQRVQELLDNGYIEEVNDNDDK